MPDLSACYFCGAAADAPVREYDVVPDAVDEVLQSTATLCPGCRTKLETVLSTVARGARAGDEPVDVELRPVEDDDPDDAGGADDAGDESLNIQSDDLFESAGTATGNVGGDPDAAADLSAADAIAFDAGADSSDTGTDPSGTGTEPSETGASGGAGAEPSGASGDAGASSGPNAGRAAGGDGRADAESQSAGTPTERGGSAGSSNTPNAGGVGGSDAPDVERPDTATYNKIIRLLQNREFPVNRSEFSDLASSAYDVPPDECARVIDYAIHRGELREDRGMLKKP